MDVLTQQEIDSVAGGVAALAVIGGIAAFVFLNLDKISDSYHGFMDGLSAGFNGADVTAVCKS